jgi:hypothetical protein
MAGDQRKCAKCRFFTDAGIPGNGWCTHPKRQMSSDVKLLVRAGELACRNSWGGDLFQSKLDNKAGVSDSGADLPGNVDPYRDDEVTSVTIPRDRANDHTGPEEDRVVSDRPVPPRRTPDDDPHNDAARRDQDERARIIARGSRDALMHARERHSTRNSRTDPGDETDRPADRANDRIVAHQARFSYRSPSRFARPAYGGDPVPRAESQSRHPSLPDRFDSVPNIDPSFGLPNSDDRSSSKASTAASAGPLDDRMHPVTSYEHVVQRARRIREEKQLTHRPIRRATTKAHALTDARDFTPDPGSTPEAAVQYQRESDSPIANAVSERQSNAGNQEDRHDPAESGSIEASTLDPDVGRNAYNAVRTADRVGASADAWQSRRSVGPRATHTNHGRAGWLSRLGLGRQESESWHDESLVTRHIENDSDDMLGGVGRSLVERSSSVDEESAGPDPNSQELQPETSENRPDQTERVGNWQGGELLQSVTVVDSNNIGVDAAGTGAPEMGLGHDAVALSPPATMHRQRLVPELPDLDDNLFEERFERSMMEQRSTFLLEREPASTDTTGDAPDNEDLFPMSPRESYFRAARYREWGPPTPDNDASTREEERVSEGELPDLAAEDFDLRDVVARGSELLDMTIDIAPDVPRECRTCRSFRSADGGVRGWCTNEWAFTHRRMVNEDDLACDSTIGCWWLPADRYWLIEEQDGYAATPRMDELVARRNASVDENSAISGVSG